ncbi:MAG: AMP-binding protein [Candidatus Eremiobacteraeota bacterium]|nr:AMP-binding protein [Candidatus Eremiobacteraeota bacterium]
MTQIRSAHSGVRFAWNDDAARPRVAFYPPEEGDRTRAQSPTHWSPVESLPRERIEAMQLEKLRALLHYAETNSPFYAARWKEAGIRAAGVDDLGALRRFPIVTKEDFERDQLAQPPFGTVPTTPPGEQMKLWHTSGTAGPARLWTETKEDWENGMYLYARSLFAHGIRPGWRGFFAFGYPPFIGFWLAHYAAEMMGCQVVPKGTLPTEAWLRTLQRLSGSAPAFLCSTPTYAQRQLEAGAQNGIDAASLGLDVLTLAGEPGACVPATKAALERGWHAVVHDIMGSTETSGPLLFTCEEQARLREPSCHANVDYFVLEVLDPATYEPRRDGEQGVLCVTALARTGMPAVRFLLNDYVRLEWSACACGRTLPLVKGGIATRADDMLIVRGVNLYPALIENVVRGFESLAAEYVIERGASVRISLEALSNVDPAGYPALAQQVQRAVAAATSLTLPVDVHAPGSLARAETKSKHVR